jgi:hypothetical protein
MLASGVIRPILHSIVGGSLSIAMVIILAIKMRDYASVDYAGQVAWDGQAQRNGHAHRVVGAAGFMLLSGNMQELLVDTSMPHPDDGVPARPGRPVGRAGPKISAKEVFRCGL